MDICKTSATELLYELQHVNNGTLDFNLDSTLEPVL